MTRVQATGKAAYSYSRSSQESAFIDALLSHGENIQSILQRIINQLDSIRFKEYWLIGNDIILHELSSSFSIQSQLNQKPCSDDLLYNAFLHCLYEKSKGHRFPLSVDSSMNY